MIYKIINIFQLKNNLQVVVSHEDCEREVFSFPIESAKDNKYLEELDSIFSKRKKAIKVKIDQTVIGKERRFEE